MHRCINQDPASYWQNVRFLASYELIYWLVVTYVMTAFDRPARTIALKLAIQFSETGVPSGCVCQ